MPARPDRLTLFLDRPSRPSRLNGGPTLKVTTYEATVENGQIKLSEDVHLPEHARVYVVIPDVQEAPRLRIASPRFVRREDAAAFVKEVVEEPGDAEL